MHRFYCPDLVTDLDLDADGCSAGSARALGAGGLSDAMVSLDLDQTHHARDVLRLREGEAVELFDGRGWIADACLLGWPQNHRGGARLELMSIRRREAPVPRIDVGAALPKGPRSADLANGLSQLGADRLIPLGCDRSSVDPRRVNRSRLQRAAIESAKQCRRGHLMVVDAPATVDELIGRTYDLRLIACPQGTLDTDLSPGLRAADRIVVLIGPEGGWTDREMVAAEAGGAIPWLLGPHVLRIETACSAAVSILRYLTRQR